MNIKMNENIEEIMEFIDKQNDEHQKEYKMIIAVRKDLKLPKGKLAVQVAHAAVDLALKVLKYNPEIIKKWKNQGSKKIAVWVENEEQLWELKNKAENMGIMSTIIHDAGRTVVKPNTITCIGIGPEKEENLSPISDNLKLI